ncbi:alpha/beta hydrolase [Kitasatospora sp. NBC_01266]|uniref:alpha/beta hydrolase n=1 Tax=Kitasatospora sp. NBC_01266 TaxID=2903572 RepID=UPI002E33202D|nr:alpha/beta hydrolase [Kitasatospora sp. NBC_01266]
MRTEVEFRSGGHVLRGWLEQPADRTGPVPVVVMTHGFGGVKEWLAEASARMAAAGFAVLAYDHPHFGTSDGLPRQHIDPTAQVHGYRDAISYVQSRPDLDASRVAVWGTSLAGAVVLVVGAVDPRVRAVIAQIPMLQPWTTLRRMIPQAELDSLLAALSADRSGRCAGRPAAVIPIAGDGPGAALPDQGVRDHLVERAADSATFRNEVTLAGIDALLEFAPEAFVERIGPRPLLMTVADADTLCPTDLALAAFAAAREPKSLQLIPGGHHSVYRDQFEPAINGQIEFLRTHLATPPRQKDCDHVQ